MSSNKKTCNSYTDCKDIQDDYHLKKYVHYLPKNVTFYEVVSILQKKPCKDFYNCSLLKNQDHLNNFTHMCSYKTNCNKIKDLEHQNQFVHICPYGLDCSNNNEQHLMMFQHPISIEGKRECSFGSNCTKSPMDDHYNHYYHPCKYGELCKNIKDQIHINRFTHPCTSISCNDKSNLHQLQFIHPKKLIEKMDFSSPKLTWKMFDNQKDSFKGINIKLTF